MPSDKRSSSAGSGRSGHSAGSRYERASGSMGYDGGEVGRRMAAEDEYIRRELAETTAFCNAFWGTNDAGYETVQARMKGASRTMDELKAMYKERADIEAEYAKRLAKLAKQPLGRDETGSMRAALDTVRMELETTSRTHSDLSNMVRNDLEGGVGDFAGRTGQARKNSQLHIEKLYKNKQTQEHYVNKAREKYEQDCVKINGYTAQSSLVQGKDLDKVVSKLDKAQATVASNDKDYQNFVRALKDTTAKWNSEWKSYLDQCQDLEEERLDFVKASVWDYANAVSAVCVADDESCERVRVSLENCEAIRDIQQFIQLRGTGAAIPDPPEYINYAKGQPPPARPSFKIANFQRNTARPQQLPVQKAPPPSQAPFPNAQGPPGKAGPPPGAEPRSRKSSSGSQPGAQGPPPPRPSSRGPPPSEGGAPVAAQFKPPPGAVGLPGMASPTRSSPSGGANDRALQQQDGIPQSSSLASVGSDQRPPPERRMSARNFMARTPSMSSKGHTPRGTVDFGRNGALVESPLVQTLQGTPQAAVHRPADQQAPAQQASAPHAPAAQAPAPAQAEDPIAKALASLRARPGGRSPGPASPGPPPPMKSPAHPGYAPLPGGGPPQGPGRTPSPSPTHMQQSRPRSPSAALMQAPQRSASPMPVEEVVASYGQSLPGERKSLSRQNSVATQHAQQPPHENAGAQPPVRGRSPRPDSNANGFAGVGALGRSLSPQPFGGQQPPRAVSPSPSQLPQAHARPASVGPQSLDPRQRVSGVPQAASSAQGFAAPQLSPQRSTTPLGIALDATGSVTHDQMAEEYMRRSGSVPPPQTQQQAQPQRQPPQQHRPQAQYAHPQRPPSQQAPPPVQQQQPSQHGLYQNSHHQTQPSMLSQYSQSPATAGPPPQPPSLHSQYSYHTQQPSHQAPPPMQGYQPPPLQQQPQQLPPQQQQQQQQQQPSYGQPPPFGRSSSSYGGYAPPQTPYGPPPTAGSQSLHSHLSQQPGRISSPAPGPGTPAPAPSMHYQQSSGYMGHQQTPSMAPHHPNPSETPASAYALQYQQSHQMQPPHHAGQSSNTGMQPPPQQQQQQQWQQANDPNVMAGMRSSSPAPPAMQQQQPPQPHQQQPQQPQQQQQQQQPQPGQAPGQSYPPTGQYSDSGKPILFYVKALYDYTATLDEEFSFTAGDIIAVTHTEADGWWQGELLDEARRRQGANTFPSNFVVLLM